MVAYQTKGGDVAHWIRRLIHISIAVIPFVYYDWISLSFSQAIARDIVIVAIGVIVILEWIRLHFRFIAFAQREHEATYISSFAWTGLSLSLVLLLSPSVSFAIPIILSCALVDPVLGELRAKIHHPFLLFFIATVMVSAIWLVCAEYYSTPLWLAFLMGPVTVAAEWPVLKWIDDNALMMLVPLMIVFIFAHSIIK